MSQSYHERRKHIKTPIFLRFLSMFNGAKIVEGGTK